MGVESQTRVKRARTARVLAIPIFCGIFSFCHWFIFFPLMWTYLSKHGMTKFWLFALIAFLMWLVIMALCLCCWWYDKKRENPIQCSVKNTTTLEYHTKDNLNSPIFKTKSSAIQPGYKATSTGDFDSEKEILCMRSIPIQQQDASTPAMYNQHTGRRSFDSTDVRSSFDSAQKVQPDPSKEVLLVKKETNHKFINISSSDSDRSSKATLNERPGGYELLLMTDSEKKQKGKNNVSHTTQAIIEQPIHEKEIHLRTKRDHRATAQEPTKVHLSSDSEDEELFKHIDMDIRLSDQNIGSRDPSGRLFSQSGDIEHLKECNSPDADRLSQNMPVFDDYLHIVSIETPLSPREVFFSDLIKQANETEQNSLKDKEGGGDRRSYCMGDITYNKLNYDDRKSVPLFLYSDQWRQETQTPDGVEVPEQNVDSDDNQDIDQVVVEPEEIEHIRLPEPKESDMTVEDIHPKKNDCNDMKVLTQMFIDKEKFNYCYAPFTTRPIDVDKPGFNRDVEQIDDSHKPRFPQGKPLKLTQAGDGQVTEPKPKPIIEKKEITEPEFQKSRAKSGCCEDEHKEKEISPVNKRESTSEYFIADIDGKAPQSVTSEVFFTVGASGLVSVPSTLDRGLQPRMSSSLPKAPDGAALDLGQWSEQGKQDMKRELSQDKLEYKSEDDDVFEDVQMALTRLRRNK